MLDFSDYIDGRTRHFTGRDWVFRTLEQWLAHDSGRTFLLTGDPGTGKSAIAARLVQMAAGEIDAGGYPTIAAGALTHYHFCQAALESTLSPLTFVQALSEQLANRYPAFRAALESIGSRQIVINTVQNVGTAVQVIGAQITIEMSGGDARPLFDQAVRRPLEVLCRALPAERVVILVDSLDEALLFDAETNIAQLLKLASDFPRQVRFIATCRSNTARVSEILGKPTLDLLHDAPPDLDEVRSYALLRLAELAEPVRSALAGRIADASHGNFLYAHHVLNDFLRRGGQGDPNALELPKSLEDAYSQFLRRELTAARPRWNDTYRPLLGSIAVARGAGLTKLQLTGITGLAEDTISDVLDVCSQYVTSGETADAPYRIYHQSFREFLQRDATYGVYPAERHAAVARYLQDRYGANWARCNDDYALRYTPAHWVAAAMGSVERRDARTQALIELTSNAKYQRQFEKHIGDLPLLGHHVESAAHTAAQNDHEDMLPWLLRAVRALTSFRKEYLRGESVVALARAGKLQQAEGRLTLFEELGDDWQIAARLILAWLAAEKNSSAAEALRARVTDDMVPGLPLRLLRDRLDAALRRDPSFPADVQAALPLEAGQELVRRVSGQEYDRELLGAINPSLMVPLGAQSELIEGRGYAAGLDAPLIVHMARQYGADSLVDEYIDAHAGYNYVEYRNRSLWIVLQAVLRHHGDQLWVLQRLGKILSMAMTGGGVDFAEMLPLTAAALLEQSRGGEARAALERWRDAALAAADLLQQNRGANDSWGSHKRRLTALAELYALVPHDARESRRLLERIGISISGAPLTGRTLPYGFAGFQAPATLRLADALRATKLDTPPLLASVCDSALHAAHNVQDYHFAARVTARCNALARWHRRALSASDLAHQIRTLANNPSAPEFSADHVVHEPYAHRRDGDPNTLSIHHARRAQTLEELMEVFQRSAVEFRRINPEYGLQEVLPPGVAIRVPDPGLPPLLAVQLAARCLAQAGLEDERSSLIRALVPIAMRNPTAADTVVSYLLIAAELEDVELIEDIAEAAGPVTLADPATPVAQIGPS